MHWISGLILATGMAAALPAQAAPRNQQDIGTRVGAFAGGRATFSFGGPGIKAPRMGLMVAPTFVHNGATGFRHGYGSGVELGFAGRDPHLSAGGMTLWRGGAATPAKDRLALSTLGTAGLVVAGVALVGGVIFAVQVAEASRNSD